MFYVIIGMWVIGYLITCRLMKVECKKLFVACPFLVVATALTSILLYLSYHAFAASIVMVVGISLSLLFILAIYKQKTLDA